MDSIESTNEILWICWLTSSKDWINLVDFTPFLLRETTFKVSCLLYCTPSPFGKGVFYKRKEFAPYLEVCIPERQVFRHSGSPTPQAHMSSPETAAGCYWCP